MDVTPAMPAPSIITVKPLQRGQLSALTARPSISNHILSSCKSVGGRGRGRRRRRRRRGSAQFHDLGVLSTARGRGNCLINCSGLRLPIRVMADTQEANRAVAETLPSCQYAGQRTVPSSCDVAAATCPNPLEPEICTQPHSQKQNPKQPNFEAFIPLPHAKRDACTRDIGPDKGKFL